MDIIVTVFALLIAAYVIAPRQSSTRLLLLVPPRPRSGTLSKSQKSVQGVSRSGPRSMARGGPGRHKPRGG